jgi:site-specific recombinase XerD
MTTSLTHSAVQPTLALMQKELERDPRLQSHNSRRGYLADLTAFEAWRHGRTLTKLLVEEYAAHLQHLHRSPNSINRILAAVRWWSRRLTDIAFETVLSQQQRDEIITQAARVAAVHDVAGERQPAGRHIGETELSALLQACQSDNSPAGARDAALIALAWSTGLRRSEIAGLRLDDLKNAEGKQRAMVRGKGNKVRVVYLHPGLEAWLKAWLKYRGQLGGPLFCPVRKGGHVAAQRGLSNEALAQILARRCLQAGLTEPTTWHDFRRTFAGNLLDSGVDLVTVQKLLGHSSPTTTSHYDRRGEEVRQRAVQNIKIPFKP